MIDWQKNPLIPVVAQEATTKEVLMLAYADRQAFDLTLATGYAHYFSRSRKRIWKKGEESGHLQKIVEVLSDCDGDSLLYIVDQTGVACHTGRKNCFFVSETSHQITHEPLKSADQIYGVIDTLYHTILDRKNASGESSYVASLMQKGENTILKKVIEEAGEFAFAIKDNNEKEIVYEASDLLFHALVALGFREISPDRIKQELVRRMGTSGIEEKRSRKS